MNSETLSKLDSYSKNKYKYGFVTEIDDEKPKKGLNEDTIKFISQKKMSLSGCWTGDLKHIQDGKK